MRCVYARCKFGLWAAVSLLLPPVCKPVAFSQTPRGAAVIDSTISVSVLVVGFWLGLFLWVAFCYTPDMKTHDKKRAALSALGRWLVEGILLAAVAWFFFAPTIAGAIPARAGDSVLITDLPPGVVVGADERIDIFIDAAPVAATVLRACQYFAATCAFSGDSGFRIGYVCSGDKKTCWRSFLRSVQAAGVGVLAQPAAGGGSFVFSASAGGAPVGAPPSAGGAGNPPPLGAGETPAPSTAPAPAAGVQ